MRTSRKSEIERLQHINPKLFSTEALNILNGQSMYDELLAQQLMGDADFAPFNEAMCAHATTPKVFSDEFMQTRATGHQASVEDYIEKVIAPLENLFKKSYQTIVLWFGEDLFCQMNVLTFIAYLEQSGYKGQVFLHHFDEEIFKVNQVEILLGDYAGVYEEVLVKHSEPSIELIPVMNEAIATFLALLNEDNEVTRYIAQHKDLPTTDLLNQLFTRFSHIGYGDVQYLALINRVK